MTYQRLSIAAVLLAALGGPSAAQGLSGQEPKILDLTRGSWAYFRDYNGRQLVYFTHLEVYRCGIATARYSFNSDALDREWPLQPCDANKPNEITTDRPYVALPLGAGKWIAVQLTFRDGSKSAVVRIDSDNKLIR